MSRWLDLYDELTRAGDTVDTVDIVRHSRPHDSTVSHSVNSVASPPSANPTGKPALPPLPPLHHSVPRDGSLPLRDGRRMWRFRADTIPSSPGSGTAALLEEARTQRVVLAADGATLVVVEPWRSTLPPEVLRRLRERAGDVIAALRGEHRARHP